MNAGTLPFPYEGVRAARRRVTTTSARTCTGMGVVRTTMPTR
jgi:hypothetical protein